MSFNKYFQDELAYLRDLGQEFAQANPKLAPVLGDRGTDPDVERLLEGFAFLTGRLRQKLDDDLPELTHGLIALMWPNYLRSVPAMSILEFEPVANAVGETKRIPRGTEIDSVPVEGTACRFRTCYDVDLQPLTVAKASVKSTGAGSTLTVSLKALPGVALDRLDLTRLRFHIHGDPQMAQTLLLWFGHYLTRAGVRLSDGKDAEILDLGPDAVRPAGFADDEGLLPYGPNTFPGYRLLQEYFNLPEKFLFLDVGGLDRLALPPGGEGLELVFEFGRPLEEQVRVRKDTLRLNCTPIANLFERDADPIRVDQTKTEYRLRPASQEPAHYEIYAIERVEGWLQGSGRKRQYRAFESFEHVQTDAGDGGAVFYRARIRPAAVGRGVEHYLAFVDPGDQGVVPPTETVSIALTCSNRNLAEKLRPGDIATATGSSPEYARFRNIGRVSPSVSPPLHTGLHWQLISNLSLNYQTLANIDALKMALFAYDFRAFTDRKAERERRLQLDGLIAADVDRVDRLFKGHPIRGVKTTLRMREANFGGEGGLYLMASVLAEFFSLYASLNSFHQLAVVGEEQGEVYQWPVRIGQQPLL